MNIIKIVCTTIFIGTVVYASTGSVSGTIASDGLGLPGANVSLIGSDLGAVTDSLGGYYLTGIPTGKYLLRVDYIGYETQTKEIYITLYDLDEKNETGSVLVDKLGIDVELEESQDILKGNALKNVNFELISSALGLNEVVVSAAKVKQKITEAPSVIALVNEISIRRNVGVDDFNRLVSFVKGVDVTYFGIQGAQINARGFDGAYSTRFRQYEDGIYMGELVTGQVYSQIVGPPKESISKIEVLFGPQSALYGPDATQGLLNIIKKHPRENDLNEINVSANNLGKYRMGGRFSKVYEKLAFDVVFEGATAKELEYGNLTGKNPAIYYATDENDDGDYDDIGADGTPERDTLKTDYYSEMDQNRISLRSNFYYTLPNNAELSLSLKNIYGQGYAMGSVGPMYTVSNNTNTISTKYASNLHTLRYTLLSQEQSTIPRQNLARFEVQNQELSWDDAISSFDSDTMFWNMELNSLDHFVDYQWNTHLSSILQIVAGFDYEYKDPNTNRTAITDDGYDYFSRETKGEDITEYRYGVYGQVMTDYVPLFDITASLRYDDHEFYGDMISPRLAIVKDDFLNGSLKFIAGRGFKAPSITERNLYSGIVDAATGSSPYPWKVQGIAMGNNTGFTRYDFYDVGNGQWDIYEPFVDANYGPVGLGNDIETVEICETIGGTFDPSTGYCGNGVYDFIDLNQNGVMDDDESYEPYWEMDGNGIYGPEDILIDSTYIQPLKVEKFTSYEIAYIGMVNKNTLIDVNAYYGIYENFKTPLKFQGITGPFFLNDGLRTAYPFSTRQINRGDEVLGGHFFSDPDEYIYVQTYESMPVEINFIGLDLGFKHMNEKFELLANISYFDDSDLVDKREKAEKYYDYILYPDSLASYSDYEKYKNFNKVNSNTSNFKYNTTVTLIDPIIENLDISFMIKGNTPYDFVSGVFQATKSGKGENYDPLEGYKVDGGQVGGEIYIDLNLNYKLNEKMNIGFGIKNLLESSTVSFPMSPAIPRSFVLETGYQF